MVKLGERGLPSFAQLDHLRGSVKVSDSSNARHHCCVIYQTKIYTQVMCQQTKNVHSSYVRQKNLQLAVVQQKNLHWKFVNRNSQNRAFVRHWQRAALGLCQTENPKESIFQTLTGICIGQIGGGKGGPPSDPEIDPPGARNTTQKWWLLTRKQPVSFEKWKVATWSGHFGQI